jgi:hypothetical protein
VTRQSSYTLRQKGKKYKSYLADNEEHKQSIIEKHGMPPKTQPPKLLTEDIISMVRTQQRQDWRRADG